MKLRLIVVGQLITKAKTGKKIFEVPYFMDIFKSPIIEVEDRELPQLNNFFAKFNVLTRNYQIAFHPVSEFLTKGDSK